MKTTQLFVELIIIGIGAAIWLLLILISFLDLPLGSLSLQNINAIILTPFLGVVYVLGIVLDRISYQLFDKVDKKRRDKILGSGQEPSAVYMQRYVIMNSEKFEQKLAYTRSRLRIARSWIVNFTLISIFFFVWQVRIKVSISFISILIISATFMVLAFFTYYSWRKLTDDSYYSIKHSYEYLVKVNSKTNQANSTDS